MLDTKLQVQEYEKMMKCNKGMGRDHLMMWRFGDVKIIDFAAALCFHRRRF